MHRWVSLCRLLCLSCSRFGVLWTQKLKTHLLRTQSLKVLPLKPGVSQNIVMYASHSARNFFLELISSFPVHSSGCRCYTEPTRYTPLYALPVSTGSQCYTEPTRYTPLYVLPVSAGCQFYIEPTRYTPLYALPARTGSRC